LNLIDNAIDVTNDVVIPESEHSEIITAQMLIARGIIADA
jgi:hypothetical protein